MIVGKILDAIKNELISTAPTVNKIFSSKNELIVSILYGYLILIFSAKFNVFMLTQHVSLETLSTIPFNPLNP